MSAVCFLKGWFSNVSSILTTFTNLKQSRMVYLSDLLETKQKEVFQKHGAFWAFNQDQFEQECKPKTTYISLGAGLYVPKDNKKKFNEELSKAIDEARLLDIELHGLEKIAEREMYNHEVHYTGDLSQVSDSLLLYPGMTLELLINVYSKLEKE